jgi:hypothetical protein
MNINLDQTMTVTVNSDQLAFLEGRSIRYERRNALVAQMLLPEGPFTVISDSAFDVHTICPGRRYRNVSDPNASFDVEYNIKPEPKLDLETRRAAEAMGLHVEA